jgi:hypothetical protein
VEAAKSGDRLLARREMEVEGITEHKLVAELADLARGESADARLRGQRDERRRRNSAVRNTNQARAGVAITGLDVEPEPVWIRPDPVRLWVGCKAAP